VGSLQIMDGDHCVP